MTKIIGLIVNDNCGDLYKNAVLDLTDFTAAVVDGCYTLSIAAGADSTSANNGLTETGNNIALGGVNPLLANTSILTGGFNLTLSGAGHFIAPVGTVGAPGIAFEGQTTDGFYSVSGTQIGVAINGALSTVFNTSGIAVGTISELVGGVGTTVANKLITADLLIANNLVAFAMVIRSATTTGVTQALLVDSIFVDLTLTTAADLASLPNGTQDGQFIILTVVAEAAAGNGLVVTPTTALGFTTITFTAAGTNIGDTATLIWKAGAWRALSSRGNVVIA